MGKLMAKMRVGMADLLLLNGSFVLMILLRRGRLEMGPGEWKLLVLVNGIWLLVSLWNREKFRLTGYRNRWHIYYLCGQAALYMLCVASLFVVILGYSSFSRYLTLGPFVTLLMLEVVTVEVFRRLGLLRFDVGHKPRSVFDQRVSVRFAVADLALFILSFYTVLYLKRGSLAPGGELLQMLLIHVGLWLVTSGWTLKFHKDQAINAWYAYSPFVKAAFMMAALYAVIVYVFNLFVFSRVLRERRDQDVLDGRQAARTSFAVRHRHLL